eukprot:2301767-Amphidinium_carterae.1
MENGPSVATRALSAGYACNLADMLASYVAMPRSHLQSSVVVTQCSKAVHSVTLRVSHRVMACMARTQMSM